MNPAWRSLVCEAKETAVEAVASVNDSTWQSFILNSSDTPALVEFWAPWCGPCRMIEPVVIELAQQYAGKLNCFKLNTDASPSIATVWDKEHPYCDYFQERREEGCNYWCSAQNNSDFKHCEVLVKVSARLMM